MSERFNLKNIEKQYNDYFEEYAENVQETLTKIHGVFDLDSTLIHSTPFMEQLTALELYTNPKNMDMRDKIYKFDMVDATKKEGTGYQSSMWGVFRPHLHDFIDFCFLYFEGVHIWSAGQYKYVHHICEQIFPHQQPDLILTYEDCGFEGSYPSYKPLTKMYGKDKNKNMNATNTFVIDDRKKTFDENPKNGIEIPPFEFGNWIKREDIMKDDICLLQLKYFLLTDEVMKSNDIRNIDKKNIFKTPLSEYKEKIDKKYHYLL
jgi:hypothetical protein